MTLPVINAVINFSTGPSFAQAMILDTGILDTNILADSVAVIVDVSNQVIAYKLTEAVTHRLTNSKPAHLLYA
jgi:hypothetical protein